VLERLGALQCLYLDKTGTLTAGTLRLVRTVTDPECSLAEREVLNRVAALQHYTLHPLATAVREAVGTVPPLPFTDVRYHAGLGVEGWLNGSGPKHLVLAGSRRFVEAAGLVLQDPLATAVGVAEAEGGTTVLTGWDGRVQAALVFQESLRPETEAALRRFQTLGLHPEILTGDTSPLSREVAQSIGTIPVRWGLLPEEKVDAVRATAAAGIQVGMVGDGINDAPALAAAEVGIALGTKAALTREAADVNILEPDLSQVVWLVEYARRVRRVIRQNLWWAFGYNGVAVGLAACGRLNPLVAALAMVLSSVFILGNARRLAGG
jgi:P-type Cu+ transporter